MVNIKSIVIFGVVLYGVGCGKNRIEDSIGFCLSEDRGVVVPLGLFDFFNISTFNQELLEIQFEKSFDILSISIDGRGLEFDRIQDIKSTFGQNAKISIKKLSDTEYKASNFNAELNRCSEVYVDYSNNTSVKVGYYYSCSVFDKHVVENFRGMCRGVDVLNRNDSKIIIDVEELVRLLSENNYEYIGVKGVNSLLEGGTMRELLESL
ncbi:hypothetical protein [Catenovulum sediminis]|uniref:Lipoprotein n=1 Tax=Catenovulum sediminis TaxID=1740262 RepID=A0ABV1RCN7_9ALTE